MLGGCETDQRQPACLLGLEHLFEAAAITTLGAAADAYCTCKQCKRSKQAQCTPLPIPALQRVRRDVPAAEAGTRLAAAGT
jgi:hypothetical protein